MVHQTFLSDINLSTSCIYYYLKQPIDITTHMPQRTSKILLVRLTANKNGLLSQIRVTCFARYTV